MAYGNSHGSYTLIEQIALGGMAEIWLAHKTGPVGFEKLFVVKKIRPEFARQPSFLQMFLNEARLAAQLNHPNIVQIYDLEKIDDTYFIAMEYIFGRDTSEIAYKAKANNIQFPLEYATRIILQVCEGLYHAHSRCDAKGRPLNIVHRDISPQNILVSFDGNVKILDFGIAKAANQLEQTQHGVLKGKVYYMSPEQILGDPIDARSDIFSVGSVFYELITGFRLFSGENDLAILRSITEGKIQPPSYFNRSIPPDLEAIIMTTLQTDPNNRYPNAWELQQDLNLLLKRFAFTPTNIHLANFLRQLFADELSKEERYLQRKIEELKQNYSHNIYDSDFDDDDGEQTIMQSKAKHIGDILNNPELLYQHFPSASRKTPDPESANVSNSGQKAAFALHPPVSQTPDHINYTEARSQDLPRAASEATQPDLFISSDSQNISASPIHASPVAPKLASNDKRKRPSSNIYSPTSASSEAIHTPIPSSSTPQSIKNHELIWMKPSGYQEAEAFDPDITQQASLKEHLNNVANPDQMPMADYPHKSAINDDIVLSVRIDQRTYDQLVRLAVRQQSPLESLLRNIITQSLRSAGLATKNRSSS